MGFPGVDLVNPSGEVEVASVEPSFALILIELFFDVLDVLVREGPADAAVTALRALKPTCMASSGEPSVCACMAKTSVPSLSVVSSSSWYQPAPSSGVSRRNMTPPMVNRLFSAPQWRLLMGSSTIAQLRLMDSPCWGSWSNVKMSNSEPPLNLKRWR